MYKHTRIHFDTVRRLDDYLELETVVKNISFTKAQRGHRAVIRQLALAKLKKVAISYNDLLS